MAHINTENKVDALILSRRASQNKTHCIKKEDLHKAHSPKDWEEKYRCTKKCIITDITSGLFYLIISCHK
jgi:hypothetical protein